VQADEYERLSNRQKMAYWEKQKDLERDLDMREIEEYKEVKRLIDEGEVGFLPEKISNRILQRLVSSVLFPTTPGDGWLSHSRSLVIRKHRPFHSSPGDLHRHMRRFPSLPCRCCLVWDFSRSSSSWLRRRM
jgi:hypothetical protein